MNALKEQLRDLIQKLCNEFQDDINNFLSNGFPGFGIGIGTGINMGRYSGKNHSVHFGIQLDNNILLQSISRHFLTMKTPEELFSFLTSNKLWQSNDETYERSSQWTPSEMGLFAGGFILRNYEINSNQFIINKNSFELAFNELWDFIERDFVAFKTIIKLENLKGDYDSIQLTPEVKILKVDAKLAKIFSLTFPNSNIFSEVEMHPDDYCLELTYRIPKVKYYTERSTIPSIISSFRSSWETLVLLALPGHSTIGKQITITKDWPLARLTHSIHTSVNHNVSYNSRTVLNNDLVEKMLEFSEVIKDMIPYKELDKKIRFSIERLEKSKLSSDVNDRVVELALAFEYLINTNNAEVTLQLTVKIIKLLGDKYANQATFNKIKSFYKLRGHVVHGNDKIKLTDANIIVINFMEECVQYALIKIIKLQRDYTYKMIDEALTQAMYASNSLDFILAANNTKHEQGI